MPLHIATLMDDFVVVDWVCRSCIMTIQEYDTRVNLIVLDIIDYDVILCIDWLYPYHAVLVCFAKTVALAMPDIPLIYSNILIGMR